MGTAFRRWVEVLEPGTYRLSDGHVHTFTPADTRNAVVAGNRMLAAGLRVPCCWAHQPEAFPAYLSHDQPVRNPALDYFGEVKRYRLAATGRAEALVDIPDRADARQFRKVNGVSPRLQRDWVDEQAVRWGGLTVAHVAATPTPIQRRLRRPTDLSHVPGTVSARAVYDLAHATREAAPMADENEDKGDKGGGEKGGDKKAGGSGGGSMTSVLDSLAQLGIDLGSAGAQIADLDQLDQALKVAVSMKSVVDLDDDLDDGPGDDTTNAPPPPALMSHFTAAAKTVAADLDLRVKRLFRSGRVDAKTRDRLVGQLKTADLSHASFTPAGELKPLAVVQQIEAYEALPAGKFSKENRVPAAGADLSHTVPGDPPPDGAATESAAVLKRQEELARKFSVPEKA
jgi:hypothetical protein